MWRGLAADNKRVWPGKRQPSQGNAPAPISLDVEEMRRRLADDDELIADVIRLFLEECPARVHAIAAALESADAGQVQTVAHALRGSASMLAAHGVANAAHTLESLGDSHDLVTARAHFPALVEEMDRLIGALQELQPRR